MILKVSVLYAVIAVVWAAEDAPEAEPSAAAFMSSLDAVHASCNRDASLLCTERIPFPTLRIYNSSPMGFAPMMASSPNIDRSLDEMINSALSMTPSFTDKSTMVDDVFDEMLSAFLGHLVSPPPARIDSRSASHSESSDSETDETDNLLGSNGHGVWRFEDAASAIAAHGSKMLSNDDTPSEYRRLARRLTSISPDAVKPCLGYGCKIDRCLWHMKDVGSLSLQCDKAMDVTRATFNAYQAMMERPKLLPMLHRETEEISVDQDELLEEQIEAMTVMTFFLGILLLPITIILFFKTFFGHRFRNSEKRRLRLNILNAVYDHPQIKQSVQDVIEEDLGDEPPLPPCHKHIHSSTSNSCDRLFYSLPLLSLALLLFYTSVTSPEAVLMVGAPAIALMTLYIMGKHCCRLMCAGTRVNEDSSEFEREGSQPLLGDRANEDAPGFEWEGSQPLLEGDSDKGICLNVYEGAPLIVMM